MADRLIIFSAPMVRALLDGRKTQTRRVLKKPTWAQDAGWPERIMDECGLDGRLSWFDRNTGCLAELPIPQPGDRLYVREAWAPLSALTHNDPGPTALAANGFYRADESTIDGEISRWRPSIHMPRWASRLTLHVTDVRVQRLQEISEDDAVAEGCPAQTDDELAGMEARGWFRDLWNSIYGPDAWDANPWVAAITFDVKRGNIDSAGLSNDEAVE